MKSKHKLTDKIRILADKPQQKRLLDEMKTTTSKTSIEKNMS